MPIDGECGATLTPAMRDSVADGKLRAPAGPWTAAERLCQYFEY
jgi:hypothetical protein